MATAPATRPQECVLLIEDNEDAMLLVQHALAEFGKSRYRLEWAKTLGDGLNQIKQANPVIVLLDLGLPDSSGVPSYSSVRKVAQEIPVLVLTGDSSEETEVAVTSGGTDDFLMKEQVSGLLLVQAIEAAIFSKKLQRRQKPF